ncbi:MAG: dATP/dGTP diphosphohydrolase domain-containing protein [Bacillota bacterium]
MIGFLANGKEQTGKKFDQEKLRMDLIPHTAYESLARALTYGSMKYGDNNWQDIELHRYVGALMRHFVEFLKDVNSIDEESGLRHAECMLVNAMFINHLAPFVNDQKE